MKPHTSDFVWILCINWNVIWSTELEFIGTMIWDFAYFCLVKTIPLGFVCTIISPNCWTTVDIFCFVLCYFQDNIVYFMASPLTRDWRASSFSLVAVSICFIAWNVWRSDACCFTWYRILCKSMIYNSFWSNCVRIARSYFISLSLILSRCCFIFFQTCFIFFFYPSSFVF